MEIHVHEWNLFPDADPEPAADCGDCSSPFLKRQECRQTRWIGQE